MSLPFAVWFDRCIGKWNSERRYIFNMKTQKPTNLTTIFDLQRSGEDHFGYSIEWRGNTEGIMDFRLDGATLKRSRDYFGDGAHDSVMSMIDHDTLVTTTQYDGLIFREEIRLLRADTVRLRQTIGFDEKTLETRLVGQYFETLL